MSARGRKAFGGRAGFRPPSGSAKDPKAVYEAILKQSRQSGQMNLSNRSLESVPDCVWRINIDVPEEARHISLDNPEDRWWEQVDLTKLILASNTLTSIPEDIQQLPALTVLDIHDNRLESLPNALGGVRDLQKLQLSHNNLNSLPESIGDLEKLQVLHIEYNHFTELPQCLTRLRSLEELDISHNHISVLPQSIGMLSRLFRFNICHNSIQVIPHEVGCMSSLRMLDATHNQIHTLPDELGQLRHIEELYFRHNRLTYLPLLDDCVVLKELHLGNNQIQGLTVEQLKRMTGIQVLDVRDNKLSKLPEEITLLENLERLDLTNNDLSGLPYVLGNMTKLKALVLDGNPMKGIRRDIIMRGTNELKKYLRSRIEEPAAETVVVQGVRPTGGTSGIIGGGGEGIDRHAVGASKSLDYSGKKASQIPSDIWEVATSSEVKAVNFSKNVLTSWPEELNSITSVSEVNLGFNRLTVVPSSASSLQNLVYLELRNNQLSDLPMDLTSCTRMRELNLACNRLQMLPEVVYSFSSLEILLLSDNQISNVDAGRLQKLSKLATVDLQNNNISQVPPELGLVEQLRSLQLEGNPFRVPRPAILAKGTLALLEYLRGRIPN